MANDNAAGSSPIVIQVVGYKNTGKTTIVCRLTESLKRSGYTVATVKHDAHDFEIDHEGTDSWKHSQAGADMTIITSPHRTAIMQREPFTLEQLVERCRHADWVLAEGFKTSDYPKLIIVRTMEDAGLVTRLSNPAAVIVWPDTPESLRSALNANSDKLPVIHLDDTDSMLRIICRIRDGADWPARM